MAGTTPLGLVLELDTSGAVVKVRNFADVLDELRTSADQAGDSIDRIGNTKDSFQGMMNVSTGLQQLSSSFTGVGKSALGFAKENVDAFADVEAKLQRMRMAMGLFGSEDSWSTGSAETQKLAAQYDLLAKKAESLALTTQFSFGDIVDGLRYMVQAGVPTENALNSINGVLAISSASLGRINVEGAALLGVRTVTQLNSSYDKMTSIFDMMVKTANMSAMDIEEFPEALRAMEAASSKFASTNPEDYLAMIGALRTIGLGAAQSGNRIAGFSRSIGMSSKALQGLNKDGLVAGKGGKAKAKAAEILGITREDLVEADGTVKNALQMVTTLQTRMREASKRGVQDVVIFEAFRTLFGTVYTGDLPAMLQTFSDKTGNVMSEFRDAIKDSVGLTEKAQTDSLRTWDGQMKIFSSSLDLLKVSLGKVNTDLLKPVLEWFNATLQAVINFVKGNKDLVKIMSILTIVLGITFVIMGSVLGMFAAMSLASLVLTPLLGGVTVATLTLAGAWAFFTASLAPVLAILSPLLIPFLAGMLALIAVFAAYETKTTKILGISMSPFAATVQVLINAVKGIAAAFASVFFGFNMFKETDMNPMLLSYIEKFGAVFAVTRAFLLGIYGGIKGVLVPFLVALGSLISVVLDLGLGIAWCLAAIVQWTLGWDKSIPTIKVLGYLIGVVIGVMAAWRIALFVSMVFTLAWRAATIGLSTAQIALRIILLLVKGTFIVFTAAVYAVRRAFILLKGTTILLGLAQMRLNWAFWTSPIGMIVAGIVILIVAIALLAEKTEWMKEIWRGFLEMIGMTDTVMTEAAGSISENESELLANAAGEAATRKLAEGLSDGSAEFVVPAAAGVAEDISDHVKTNSPAKKGPLHAYSPEQLGARIAQQFAEGLNKSRGNVSSGLSSMVSSYENLLTNKVNPISYTDLYSANSPNGSLNNASPQTNFSAPQGGEFKPLAKQSRGETKTIIVNATVNTGDFKMNVDSLSAAEASEFSKYVAKLMGGHIEKEMSRRNLG